MLPHTQHYKPLFPAKAGTQVERLSEIDRSDPAAGPQAKGGVLAALKRSPLIGADLQVTRDITPGRDIDL